MTDNEAPRERAALIFDTPEGIAFARAAARLGALKLGQRGVFTTVKRVYGFTGGVKNVTRMLEEYVEGILEIRGWDPARATAVRDICQHCINIAEEEHPGDPRLKEFVDAEIQNLFDIGAISEQQGNDATLLVYVEVVRQHAGRL